MKLEDFTCDATGIYTGDGNGTKAGYLDGAESYLHAVLSNSQDLGLYSSELKSAVRDWPSLYHFSPYRHTILDCLDLQNNEAAVLELGAGCGAITRWLGERFNEVHAVEGNHSRARVARLRCRDLENVKVYASNFLDLEETDRFDITTLIGVLEYSHLYHPVYKNSPYDAALSTLKKVFSSLKSRGILVLALENKLGLKYISGAREDHSGKVFDSIHGYPDCSTAVTYSAAELENMLRESGFTSLDFYLPFPDYKLASTIIKGDKLLPEYSLHNWIETPFPDRCTGERTLLFNESLAVREIIKGRMLKDLSNSFLIVAYKGDEKDVRRELKMGDEDWIAKHYTLGRYAPFCKKNTLIKTPAGELFVENVNVISGSGKQASPESPFIHDFPRETYHAGDQLIYSVFEMLVSGRFETEFIQIVKALNLFLLGQYGAGTCGEDGVPLVKGEALDVLLWNIIVNEHTGKWTVIDKEWSFKGCLPVDFIIWRNLHHMLMRYHSYIDENISESIARKFIVGCLKKIYPSFNEDSYMKAKTMDEYFQDFAHEGIVPDRNELTSLYGTQLSGDRGNDHHNDQPAVNTIDGLVSIIIPVYNKVEYTKQCLENLAANTSYSPYEVIIIDNGSTDGTGELLGSLGGNIKIISNKRNHSFAESCNQGAKAAEGEYLVFLNNDTVPLQGWLENLVRTVRERQDVAVAGSKLLYPDNTVQHAGVVFNVRESDYCIYHIYKGMDKDHPAVNHAREFNAVTAACMLVRKKVFFESGMFDEHFIYGYEDVDFCLRVRERGHKIVYNPESVLYHYEETTEGRLSYGEHNTVYFVNKWKGKINSDDREILEEDGIRIEFLSDNRLRYHNINDEKEGPVNTANPSGQDDVSPSVHGNGRGHVEGADISRKKIAVVRGASLNKWEMQNYEPMMDTYDITAFTTSQAYFDISKIEVPVVQLPFRDAGLLLSMEGLEESLADKDLVFSADITYMFSAQAVRAKQKHGNKLVCLEWENIPFVHEEHEEVRKIKQMVRNGADHFIAVTERAKEALMVEGVPEAKIDVVPMGVDLHAFRPVKSDIGTDRARLGLGKEDTVVLFIGRMVWEKGIYDFLNAAARICRDSDVDKRKLHFLIVGKGPECNAVHERAALLGITDRITFVEQYPYHEMFRLHNLADIFVLPSIPVRTWQEQFGMVLIESMACGTPVISTHSGSIPEVVGDAGLLVQPNDHLSLYEAVKTLVTDKELRESLGSRALSRAGNLFDARKNAEKFRAVFEKVMSVKTEKERLGEEYAEGLELWHKGRRDEGFNKVSEVFEADPDNKEALDAIIEMGTELKKYDIMERVLKEYLMYHPANLDVLTFMGELLIQLGKTEQAREELNKVFIFDPENSRAAALMERLKTRVT